VWSEDMLRFSAEQGLVRCVVELGESSGDGCGDIL
jgi:hypothetical protein